MPTNDPKCPFCAILSGHDNTVREVWRTSDLLAFFPTEPATLGHTLVIPRRHVETLTLLREAETIVLSLGVVEIARCIEEVLQPEGLNVIQSNGRVAEQSVLHVHVHVVPRWSSDPVGTIWPPTTNYPEAAKDEAWSNLKARAAIITGIE